MWSFPWLRNGKRSCSGGRRRVHVSPRKQASFRPRLDVLEDRCLLSFSTPTYYPVGTAPQAIVTADLNNDGKFDLVTANSGTYDSSGSSVGGGVSVLLGLSSNNGKKAPASGTFAAAQNYATGPAVSVALGDFNGDGQLDIVTGNFDGNIRMLLGKGDGTFQQGPTTTGGGGSYTAVADLDGDGSARRPPPPCGRSSPAGARRGRGR